MIADIGVVIWKELKELVQQRGRFKGGALGMFIFIGVFGILLPLQNGRAWIESPSGLIFWGWLPFILASSVVADLFAGERERHTLETLLASRLSDRAIYFGKLCAAVMYAWGLTLAGVLLSLVTVNVANAGQGLLMYPLPTFAAILAISLLVALLAGTVGVLISLRAATVRQAQQTFSLAFLALFIPIFLLPLLPAAITMRLLAFLQGLNLAAVTLGVIGLLIVLNLVFLGIGLQRFQRARLILD